MKTFWLTTMNTVCMVGECRLLLLLARRMRFALKLIDPFFLWLIDDLQYFIPTPGSRGRHLLWQQGYKYSYKSVDLFRGKSSIFYVGVPINIEEILLIKLLLNPAAACIVIYCNGAWFRCFVRSIFKWMYSGVVVARWHGVFAAFLFFLLRCCCWIEKERFFFLIRWLEKERCSWLGCSFWVFLGFDEFHTQWTVEINSMFLISYPRVKG